MNLGLDGSAGYAGSWLLGRAGFIDVSGAQKEGWVIPSDREGAEKRKEELHKLMEEREKEKKAQDPVANRRLWSSEEEA